MSIRAQIMFNRKCITYYFLWINYFVTFKFYYLSPIAFSKNLEQKSLGELKTRFTLHDFLYKKLFNFFNNF